MGELNGTFQEIAKSIEELGVKLQREEFATAEERYFDEVKDLEIHHAISEDLSNFYNALEWALMKFHKERMSVINRMVREMWHSTYKGKDIDYVEIRAEESAVTGMLIFYNLFWSLHLILAWLGFLQVPTRAVSTTTALS